MPQRRALLLVALLLFGAASAVQALGGLGIMRHAWTGGGVSLSGAARLVGSIGPGPAGRSQSGGYVLWGGFHAPRPSLLVPTDAATPGATGMPTSTPAPIAGATPSRTAARTPERLLLPLVTK